MKFCTSCGAPYKEDFRFCNGCGKEVQAASGTQAPTARAGVAAALLPAAGASVDITTALKYGHQVVLAFVWILFCELRGYDAKSLHEELITYLAFLVILAGLTYLLIVHIGIKKQKPNVVLATTIVYTALNVLAWIMIIEDFPQYNFFDWMGELITVIQIAVMFVIYTMFKPSAPP
jgi:hypothetical protein